MFKMLEKKREYHLGRGDLLDFRVWTALGNTVMQGLTHNEAHEAPTSSVQAFLAQYHFESARDEETESGYTPLVFASLSGNLPVVRELIDSRSVDVQARVRVGKLEILAAGKGMDALAIAVAYCPQLQVHEVVSALLTAGADPNGASANGITPLVAAVGSQNLRGVYALLECDKIDLEKGFSTNHSSPLGIAGYMSTFEVMKALVEAGANKAHRCEQKLLTLDRINVENRIITTISHLDATERPRMNVRPLYMFDPVVWA